MDEGRWVVQLALGIGSLPWARVCHLWCALQRVLLLCCKAWAGQMHTT